MTVGEFFGIGPRKGKILNSDRAKLRHSHAILINAGKPRLLTAKVLAGQYRISLSSLYRIVK